MKSAPSDALGSESPNEKRLGPGEAPGRAFCRAAETALVEAALPAADVPPAALVLEGAAAVIHRHEIVEARRCRPVGGRSGAIGSAPGGRSVPARRAAHAGGPRGPILGLVHPQRPALQVFPV